MMEMVISCATAHALWYFHGPDNTDADFQAYIDSFEQVRTIDPSITPVLTALVVGPGNPPPNAVWRKRIAEASRSFDRPIAFALVTPSAMLRGVLTAINWLRPPPYDARALATFDEALEWLGTFRSVGPLPTMHRRALRLAERTSDDAGPTKLLI